MIIEELIAVKGRRKEHCTTDDDSAHIKSVVKDIMECFPIEFGEALDEFDKQGWINTPPKNPLNL